MEFNTKATRGLLLALALFALPLTASADDGKIGIIDSQRIFAEFQEAKDAEALFQQEMKQWEDELLELERKIRTQQEKIRSQSLLLSQDKLDQLQTELDGMMKEYDTKKKDILDPNQGRAVLRNQELSEPINQRITNVVEQLGAEGKFDLILDVATVNAVYVADGIDLTDQVLAELAAGSSD